MAVDTGPLFAASLADVRGQPVELAKFRGRPLIVNFWARWCPPCRVEIPELNALHTRYGKQGLAIVGIAVEDEAEAIREFMAAYEMNYPVVLGKHKALWLMQVLGNHRTGLPFTLIIDARGEIALSKMGPFKAADFEALAPSLLAK